MVSSQSILYFSGVTKSHLLHHLALITDRVFTSNHRARTPVKMKTQALFQWENTIVTLCNYIWYITEPGFIQNHSQSHSQRRGEWRAGILPATSPGPASQLTPVALSLYLFLPFQCVISLLSYLGTSVASQCPSRTHTWHIWRAIYFWAAH